MSGEVCSARIETLHGFAEAGLRGRVDAGLVARIGSVGRTWDAMLAACEFRDVEGNPGPELSATMDQFRDNEGWVRAIADALADAPVSGGLSVLSSTELATAIDGRGAAPDTTVVDWDPQEIVGLPVTSGLVNDPINAATGNFVHADRDLAVPGFGSVLDVVRAYNSFNARRQGAFGRGWTSLLDVALDTGQADDGVVRLSFVDGAVVAFVTGDGGRWLPNVRRRMRLEQTDVGWTVSRHNDRRRWFFDHDGQLVGGEEGVAGYTVVRHGDGSVLCTEARTDRWVRYERTGELITSATSSDGRRCAYHYDHDANCVRVERPAGRLVYEIDSGFVVAMFDADGVMAFRNTYDEGGRVVGQVSPHGRRTTYEYLDNGGTRVTDDDDGPSNLLFHDERGNLTAMYGSDGAAMRASYDQAGRITRLVGRDGAVTTYAYHPDDELDLIVRKTDPDGRHEDREYDQAGRMIRRVDRSGAVYELTYEGDNRNPTVIAAPEGVVLTTVYDDRNLPRSVTDGDGVVTGFEWDRDGQLTAQVNGAGERTTFGYDRAGRLVSVVDPTGRSASFELDPSGRVRAATGVDGVTKVFESSPAGRILSMTTPGPGSWQAVYGDHGDLVTLTDGLGGTVGFEHDEVGHVVGIIGPDGTVTTQEWDGLGQLIAVTDPAGNRATQSYDRAGRSLAVTRYDGRTVAREVDELGRTTALIGPDGARSVRTHHPNGQLASVTDPAGATHRFEIDGLGRLIAEIDPAGGRRTYEYSAASRLVRQTTPAGRVYTYGYDAAGRPTRVTDADGVTTALSLGPDGRLASITDDARTIDFRHDEAGRVTGWSSSDDETTATLEWGTASVTVARGGDSPARFDYDPRGLLAQVTDPGGILTEFEYDIRGRIVGATTGDQTLGVAYDASGAVTERRDGNGDTASYRNTSAGRLEEVLFGSSGVGRRYHYDSAGRVSSIDGAGGDTLVDFGYDPLGRLATATVTAGDTAIERDGLGLIVATAEVGGRTTRYQRDPDGIVIARSDHDGPTTRYLRSSAGRLAGFADSVAGEVALPEPGTVRRDRAGRITADRHGRSYAYDAAGRLEQALSPSGARHRFTYNDLGLLATDSDGVRRRRFSYTVGGQLRALSADDGTTVEFEYDGAGRRTGQRYGDGSRVEYRWNDLDQLIAIDRSGPDGATTSRTISYSGLGRVGQVDDTTIGWDDAMSYKPVRVGETRYLRSGLDVRPAVPGGAWTDGTTDDPWGRTAGPAAGVGLGYRGELTVDGLVFMGDRVYDPDTRAFLSKDPRPPRAGANGAFGSPYGYAWCDPVNHVDPSGREPISIEAFEAWRSQQESNRFARAGQAMLDDPWGTVAMVGVVAVGVGLVATGVGGPIGAGILIGAAASAGMGLATDDFDPRSVAIGGAFGAVTGGGVGGAFAAGVGESVATQVLVDGRGLDEINIGQAVFEGTIGAVVPAAGSRIDNLVPAGAADDLVPTGATDELVPQGMADDLVRAGPGDSYAASVAPGGRPDGEIVFAGHGVYGDSGDVLVPDGTSVAVYAEHGQSIWDSDGFTIESGGDITPTRVFGPGETMPDYHLLAPDDLNIRAGSITVEDPTRLSELLSPDMGTCHWAACLDIDLSFGGGS